MFREKGLRISQKVLTEITQFYRYYAIPYFGVCNDQLSKNLFNKEIHIFK